MRPTFLKIYAPSMLIQYRKKSILQDPHLLQPSLHISSQDVTHVWFLDTDPLL